MIPYGKQSIDDFDVQAVTDALRNDMLTTGPIVAEFEQAFAGYVGARYAVAVNNGTSALHLAMLAAGIGPGDRVVTSTNTFLASANCAAFVGATPDFCDIDPVSYNLCPATLAANWKDDTKAVVAVDYAGQTAEMPAIASVAHQHGAVVIEDACHSLGGRFHHEGESWRVGGHPWADMTTFSFHPVKTMTTGEGGMLVTNNESFATQARLLRSHGMLRSPADFTGLGDPKFDERGPWYYEMQDMGFNARITDFQCALGLSQLARIDAFIARRREIVDKYNQAFASLQHVLAPHLQNPADRELIAWHLYTLQIEFEKIGLTRTEFISKLREQGIGTQVLYIPVHLQPWYRKNCGYAAGKCPIAEEYYLRTISLPLYPGLSDIDLTRVIQAVTKLCSGN